MAETKFTKGPWRTQHSPLICGDMYVVSDAEQKTTALVYGGLEIYPGNAHLIAAAPNMFEALEALVQQRYPFRSSGGYNEKTSIDFWKSEHEEGNGEAAFWIAAHDALRKARGEAQ